MEVETQVRVARRLAYLTEAQEGRLLGLSSEVGRMLVDTHRSSSIKEDGVSTLWSPSLVPGS